MTPFLLDTTVLLYARGGEHRYRDPCRQLVRHLQDGSLVADASVELVQEFGHVLRRRGLDGAAVRDQAFAAASLCRLHDFGQAELRLALNLIATVPALGMRDAVHSATALLHGIGLLVSSDKAFDGVPGLERVDPVEAITRLLPTPPEPRPPT